MLGFEDEHPGRLAIGSAERHRLHAKRRQTQRHIFECGPAPARPERQVDDRRCGHRY